jgi:hypothetical protein
MAGMAANLGDKNLYHYLVAKNNIDTIQYREVEEYKKKTGGIISSIEVPTKPVDNDYKYLIGQPFIPNQTLPLSNELGFQTYVEFVNNATGNDPESIKAYDPKGLYVMTSEGDGIVVGSTANQVKVKVKGSVQPVCRTRSGIHFLQQPDNRHRSLRADGLYRHDRGIPAQTETV